MGVLLRYARVVLTMIVHTVLPFVTSVQFIELAHFLLLGSGPVVTERTVVSLRMNVNHDSQCTNTRVLLCFLILSHSHAALTHNLVRVSQYIKHIYHCVFVVIATPLTFLHIPFMKYLHCGRGGFCRGGASLAASWRCLCLAFQVNSFSFLLLLLRPGSVERGGRGNIN